MQNTRSRTSASRKINFEGSEAVKTLKFNNFIVKTMVLEPPDQGPGDDFRVAGPDFALQINVATNEISKQTVGSTSPMQNIKVIVVLNNKAASYLVF